MGIAMMSEGWQEAGRQEVWELKSGPFANAVVNGHGD